MTSTPQEVRRGVVRRLQALAADGHPDVVVGRWLGVVVRRVELMRVRGSSDPEMVTAVHAVYDRESGLPGSCMVTRARARRERWAPSTAWGDIDEDDQPTTLLSPTPWMAELEAGGPGAAMDDRGTALLRDLLLRGMKPQQIAEQLRVSRAHVYREIKKLTSQSA